MNTHSPKRRRTATNAKFDRMIQTMSVVHSSPRSSSTPSGARASARRNPSRICSAREDCTPPSALASDLSFIKMPSKSGANLDQENEPTNAREAASKASTVASDKPLPSWLANTFRTLSEKHPLRLLLPPNLRSSPDIHVSTPITRTAGQQSTPGSPHIPVPQPALEEIELLDVVFPLDPLPFSTPGPGRASLLDSTTGSKTILEIQSPKTDSSSTLCPDYPVSFDEQVHGLVNPHICTFSDMDNLPTTEFQENFINDIRYDGPIVDSDYVGNEEIFPNVYNVYNTPGPIFRDSHFELFDSPAEDPFESDHPYELLSNQSSCSNIDFQWLPFDRKTLGIPNPPKRVAFACDKDIVIDDAWSPCTAAKPEEIDVQNGYAPPVSPCPFRFLPPKTPPLSEVPVPEAYHPQAATVITPPKQPFAPVPGVYISPLQTNTPSPVPNVAGRETDTRPPQDNDAPSNTAMRKSATERGSSYADEWVDNMFYSQLSNDSIESWNST
ncbi:hypothetical protein D9613_000664 [Agrocybe pediades]|uniref:Uncharacterized protein n=1 Tax=Agrocybe pediades TaxID=84607 RepID=A0A8H4VSK1_9AGAR|nr:hypothetical protein D9613_000664 [Agrocybe pediades]